MPPDPDDLVRARVALPGGYLHVLQPAEAAELPDDHPVEWAPLVPYWAVLWRSGVTLAREVASTWLSDMRVVELGCGLGVPSLAAARAGAQVLATDIDDDALALVDRNARESGLRVDTARVDWAEPDDLVDRGPFDLLLAADVLYERDGIDQLITLLPRLSREVWLADPGRPLASGFLDRAAAAWSVETVTRGEIEIHRMRAR